MAAPISFRLDREAVEDARGLLDYMNAHVPREHWPHAADWSTWTLFHYAAQRGDLEATRALLASVPRGTPPEAVFRVEPEHHRTPAHAAGGFGQPRVLELLVAAGALQVPTPRRSVLDETLQTAFHVKAREECVRILLANGCSMASVTQGSAHNVRPWMTALEAGRARCRAVVLALLGVHRCRGALHHMERHAVLLVALQVWATRADWGVL